MFYSRSNSILSLIIVIFGTCLCDEWDDADQQRLIEDFIPELYLRYRKALESSNENTVTFRRVLQNNKEYKIHVNKLKNVNGFKRHNLIVKEKFDDNPLIYVSNPVETKISNAYLSLEGFKNLLTGRVLRQRNEFKKRLHKTYATLKTMQHTTRNAAVYAKKFKKRLTKARPIKNITKPEKKKKKIADNDMMTTNDIPEMKKHMRNDTEQIVISPSQSEFPSEPVYRTNTSSTAAIEKNTPTLVNNVVTSTVALTKFDVSSSITNNLPINFYTLWKNANETTNESKYTVDNNSTSVTNISVVIESTTEFFSKKMINVESTSEQFTTEKSVTNESTFQQSNTKISTAKMSTSTTNILPTEHHILRTYAKGISNESNVAVENNSPSVTMVYLTESILKSEAIAEDYESKEIRNNLEETINTTYETATTETTIETTMPKELTTKESTTEKLTTEESSAEEINIEEAITEESTPETLTTIVLTVTAETKSNPKRKSTTIEPPTTATTTKKRKPTTTVLTTVKTTTKTKRTTLGRPLVYMGDWENGN